MDGKTVAIGVLVVAAVLLGGVVASSLQQERAAYGQGGVYATYLATSILVRDGFCNFAILDTASRRMVFYDIDVTTFALKPTAGQGRMLTTDFPHKEAP
jgi:hypothetical protein